MENVKGIFEGTRPIREGTTAIGLGALGYVLALIVPKILWFSGGSRSPDDESEFCSMINALLPHVSVAVFGTKMATHGHLLLELSKIK
jgi:hypothetical protein